MISSERWEKVREITGKNDHPMISRAMKLCGLPGNKGYPWCAACWVEIFDKAGVSSPQSARVTDWFRFNVVWEKSWNCKPPRIEPGMVGALYYYQLGRYGHIVFIVSADHNNVYCREGNTNLLGSNEGDGFYNTIRSKRSIEALADYCVSGKDFILLYDEFIQKNKK